MRKPAVLVNVTRESGLLVVLGIYAYLLTFHAGSRGFMPLDQAINFDGGWRILSGQVPYRDFVLPNGPVSILVQAAAFKVAGVNYGAYILPAAVIDVLASWIVYATVRVVFPASRLAAFAAALVTATYFYPQIGTTYMENTGFFFGLLALWMTSLVLFTRTSVPLRLALAALSGVAVAAAFLSKINVGAAVVGIPPLLAVAAHGRDRRLVLRLCAPYAVGLGLGAAAFAGWLWLASDASAFWHSVIELPSELGPERLRNAGPWRLVKSLLLARTDWRPPLLIQLVHLGIIVTTTGVWLASRRHATTERIRGRLVAALGAGTVLAQNAFGMVTVNEAVNAQPFLGLAFAATLAAVSVPAPPRGPRRAVRPLTIAAAAAVVLLGVHSAHTREMHPGIFGSGRFSEPMQDEGLSPLRWGEPTVVWHRAIREQDLLDLLAHLKGPAGEAPEPFFVFPEFTLLYGLVGVPSPQPLLWFDRGLTYPEEYDERVDRRVVEALQRHGVNRVVIERASFGSTGARLDDFPLFERWLRQEFVLEKMFGIFEVYRRGKPDPTLHCARSVPRITVRASDP